MEQRDLEAMFDLIDLTHSNTISREQLVKCLENVKASREDVLKASKLPLHKTIDKPLFVTLMYGTFLFAHSNCTIMFRKDALNSLQNTPYL